MEYQVSARKYRPMTFASVVGQEALTTTLKNAVKNGKLAHAFLFCGPRGVGKTTCARIFARTINCSSPTPDGEACGQCESCRAFQEQRSYNIFELDAASNNGVEHIKTLMEQTRIPPQVGKYKVFIIDEVHMLSTAAFNAFLKTLEEPPSYVIFILATTEKNKLLPTILSRCQIYDFDRMSVPNIINHLKMVAQKEGYTYEDEALEVIAEKADGGMRDALSIFDQAASFCQGNITLEKVTKDLNLLDIENYFNILDLAFENKTKDIMLLLNSMLSNGMDGGNIITGLAAHARNVLMAKDPQTIPLLETSKRFAERYQQQARKCTNRFLFTALKILNQCDINYRQSSAKRLLVELTLIEVAQITQPADADGAPRMGRRLKSLFNYIVNKQQKEVKQVAAAASSTHTATATAAAMSTANGYTTAVRQTSSPAPQDKAKENTHTGRAGNITGEVRSSGATLRPRIGSLGPSFSSILNSGKKDAIEKEDSVQTGEQKEFSDADLQFEWLSMCNRMAQIQKFIGLASSMKHLTPKITTYPTVEIVTNNSIQLQQINAIISRIKATLIQRLKNDNIIIVLRQADRSEIKPMRTKQEIFAQLCKQSPAFNNLAHQLNLELV